MAAVWLSDALSSPRGIGIALGVLRPVSIAASTWYTMPESQGKRGSLEGPHNDDLPAAKTRRALQLAPASDHAPSNMDTDRSYGAKDDGKTPHTQRKAPSNGRDEKRKREIVDSEEERAREDESARKRTCAAAASSQLVCSKSQKTKQPPTSPQNKGDAELPNASSVHKREWTQEEVEERGSWLYKPVLKEFYDDTIQCSRIFKGAVHQWGGGNDVYNILYEDGDDENVEYDVMKQLVLESATQQRKSCKLHKHETKSTCCNVKKAGNTGSKVVDLISSSPAADTQSSLRSGSVRPLSASPPMRSRTLEPSLSPAVKPLSCKIDMSPLLVKSEKRQVEV